MSKTKYEVEIICRNCGYSGKANLPVETMVSDNKCPICGNISIHRDTYSYIAKLYTKAVLITALIFIVGIPLTYYFFGG